MRRHDKGISVCCAFTAKAPFYITFIKIYTPCSLSTELHAIKYITVINLSISKIIKYIADIKTIKLLKEKIRLHLKNWKYTNSK